MEALAYRVRLAALWLLAITSFLVYRKIALSEKATNVSVLSNGELARVVLLMTIFAFLSLTIGNRYNRLMNMIAGGIFAILELIMIVDGLTGYSSASFNLMTAAAIVLTASIAWFAYKWPREHL